MGPEVPGVSGFVSENKELSFGSPMRVVMMPVL